MRTFFVYSRASSTPFLINDMPSSGKRMDLVARCVNSALWLSNGVRQDTRIYVTLNAESKDAKTLFFEGSKIRRVSPDERNIGSWLNKAVAIPIRDGEWTKVQDGIEIINKGFLDVLDELDGEVFVLAEDGDDVRDAELPEDAIFVMGDNVDIPSELLEKIKAKKISLGPISYLSSHCITLVNNEIDRRY